MSRLILVFALAACASRAKPAVALYEAGDYAGAVREAERGLTAHPSDRDLWGMRIRAALALGDRDALAAAYRAYRGHRGGDDRVLLRDLAVATLGQALASPSARLKVAAIEAIEDVRLYELAEQVARRIQDDDERVAAAAGVALLHDAPGAPEAAVAMLGSELAEARRIAVAGLGRKAGPIIAGELERAANDPEPRVRRAAVIGLGMVKDVDGVEMLAVRLRDPDEEVRVGAARALAKVGIGDLAAFGRVALADRARAVRLAGVELVAAAHRDDELARLAEDGDARVALAAAVAVAPRAPHPDALARAIASPEVDARVDAARAAKQIAGAGAATALKQLAGDRDPAVRVAAARALAQLGDRDAAIAALAAADTIDVAAELAALGDERGADALSAFVADLSRAPESRAAAATAHRVAHRATPGLVAALADPNALVRVSAAAACAAVK